MPMTVRVRKTHDLGNIATHALSVDLADICEPLGKDVAGHLISIFVPELSRFASCSCDRTSCICDGPCHDAANGRR